MNDHLLVHAPAKLNLALSVGSPRDDGMHPLSSWMVTLLWGDSVYLVRRDEGARSLFANVWAHGAPHTPDLDWPLRTDLSFRAHAAMEAAAGRALPVRMRVEKRIPVGGGLGGGSSNAAAVLRGLNELFELGFQTDRLRSIAASLGSDVAFLVEGGSAIVSGVGEVVARAGDAPNAHIVLAFPDGVCPTPSVYRQFDAMGAGSREPDHARVRALATRGRVMMDEPFNDLALPARATSAAVARAIDEIVEVAQQPVHVCGSGSSLFLVCDDPIHAEHIARTIEGESGVKAVATCCAPLSPSILHPAPPSHACE